MPTYVNLQRLYCERTEDWTGNDEAYLRVNGEQIWGPVSIDDNETKPIDILKRLNGQMTIELFDQDLGTWPDLDDNLGKWTVNANEAGLGDRTARFTQDEANYTLFYKVGNVEF